MTDAWQDAAIRRLKLNLKMGDGAEWLEVERGADRCRLRVVRAHGGRAYLEIDGPLTFAFLRESAVVRVKKGAES